VSGSFSLAVGDYAHVQALFDGRVRVEGLDLRLLRLSAEQVIQRMMEHREFEIAEFSFAQYVALRASGDTSLIAIPVFPSRVFRHGSIFVRADGPRDDPGALNGGRIGVPEWVQTAGIWTRGILGEYLGVDVKSIEWIQAGVNQPGRRESAPLVLPKGIRYRTSAESTLTELLELGEIDAIVTARPPASFTDGSDRAVRLFSDVPTVEREWWGRTGIFPIMHVVVLRRDAYEEARWIATSLVDAFTEAKRRSIAALTDNTYSHVPLPWVPDQLVELNPGGGEWWPYGVEPNRLTLDAFLGYCREQGVAPAGLEVDDLFAPETLTAVRV
jgi:4,5-dihydroxyphthalate decarboxylase